MGEQNCKLCIILYQCVVESVIADSVITSPCSMQLLCSKNLESYQLLAEMSSCHSMTLLKTGQIKQQNDPYCEVYSIP